MLTRALLLYLLILLLLLLRTGFGKQTDERARKAEVSLAHEQDAVALGERRRKVPLLPLQQLGLFPFQRGLLLFVEALLLRVVATKLFRQAHQRGRLLLVRPGGGALARVVTVLPHVWVLFPSRRSPFFPAPSDCELPHALNEDACMRATKEWRAHTQANEKKGGGWSGVEGDNCLLPKHDVRFCALPV